MVYKNFTDTLEELAHESGSDAHSLHFLELVRRNLDGFHIRPKSIYRAIARALVTLAPEAFTTGSVQKTAHTLISKADRMARS